MLIHKTMKMPTSCLSCWIAPTCDVWVREKSKYKGYDNRLENCPLEEVKHGHWIEVQRIHEKDHTAICECSLCGDTVWVYDGQRAWNYCPHCGAKMDEVKDEIG